MSEQAVIVEFQYGQTDLSQLFSLEDQLRDAIETAGCGEYDGHEIATDGSDGFLYMYGPDADALLAVIEPILRACPFMNGASVTKKDLTEETGEAPAIVDVHAKQRQAANEVLARAAELSQKGMLAEAASLVMQLTSSDDPEIRLRSLLELVNYQSGLKEHQEVLISLERLEAVLNEFDLDALHTSQDEGAQDFVQEMRFVLHTNAATAYEGMGRIEEAIDEARAAVAAVRGRRKSGDAERVAHREYVLATMLRCAGRLDDALAGLDAALAECASHIPSLIAKAAYLELAGRKKEGEALFATIRPQDEAALAYFTLNAPYYHALRREKDRMLQLLEEACHYWGGPFVAAYALEEKDFASYRDDQDFRACLERCRLLERQC